MKKRILFSICIILIIFSVAVIFLMMNYNKPNKNQNKQNKQGFGIFSWDTSAISPEEDENLIKCIQQADITQIYQQFSNDVLKSGEAKDFLSRMKKNSIQIYALLGEAEWAYENDAQTLIGEIKHIVEYNTKNKSDRIFGIVTDVEPYLLDEWSEEGDVRDDLMANYLGCINSAYQYARKNHLDFIVCVPTFYDVVCENILEGLFANSCDGVAVMNYNRSDEYGQMEAEVKLAREHNKEIICIYELQKAGKHTLKDINTYAGEGLGSLWKSAKWLKEQFNYTKLSFAYHYYEPLKEMLAKEDEV